LRGSKDELRDILLTDAPGEWCTSWALQEGAPDAEGARWIVRHSDAFLVFADCHRLVGSKRGEARNEVRQLLERLGNHVSDRPTALIWTKADYKPTEGIRAAIRRTLNEHVPRAIEVEASIENPETLASALEAVLRPAWIPPLASPVAEPILQHQPFAAFRGFHAHS
jgi:hypothetical protein